MSAQLFTLHPQNPQPRLIEQAAKFLRDGGIAVMPTDSCYALGCTIGHREGLMRIRQIRQLDNDHNLTLAVRDLREIARYAFVSDAAYKFMRRLTPGPYTFIYSATKDVPRMLHHPKRRTIGIRVPANPTCQALLAALDAPLLTSTLILPGEEYALGDPEQIADRLARQVDAILLDGWGGTIPTTVVDMGETPIVVRVGLGPL